MWERPKCEVDTLYGGERVDISKKKLTKNSAAFFLDMWITRENMEEARHGEILANTSVQRSK